MNSKLSVRAVKRILHDLEEIKKNPVAGISVCLPDTTDPFTLHGNLIVNEGAYKDILVHLIFHIPQDYPMSPPAVNVAPGLKFDHKYHHHLYDNPVHGNSICTDITSNFQGYFKAIDGGKNVQSGWTPGYTLTSVLMQLQIFFADPDLPKSCLPSQKEVDELKEHVLGYKLDITLNDGTTKSVVTHSHKTPYPPLELFKQTPPVVKQATKKESENKPKIEENKAKEEELVKKENLGWGEPIKKVSKTKPVEETKSAKEELPEQAHEAVSEPVEEEQVKKANTNDIANRLTCSINKVDIFDATEPILGYPIDLRKDNFGRIWATPIMEILSRDAYLMNFASESDIDENYEKHEFKSGFGSIYNFWMPIYINEAHFERSKKHIFNAIGMIYKSVEGQKLDGNPSVMVLKVLPPILVKTIVHFLKGSIHQSLVAIDAYCQLYSLFAKLSRMFPNLKKAIDQEVDKFYASDKNRHKKTAGDLGEFMIKLALSSDGFTNIEIVKLLFKEYLARQISWACKADRDLSRRAQCPDLVKKFMVAAQVSNQFFLVQLATSQLLLKKGMKAELDENYGFLSSAKMNDFREKIVWIQKSASKDWKLFVREIGLDSIIPDNETMSRYILAAFDEASAKGYFGPKK